MADVAEGQARGAGVVLGYRGIRHQIRRTIDDPAIEGFRAVIDPRQDVGGGERLVGAAEGESLFSAMDQASSVRAVEDADADPAAVAMFQGGDAIRKRDWSGLDGGCVQQQGWDGQGVAQEATTCDHGGG